MRKVFLIAAFTLTVSALTGIADSAESMQLIHQRLSTENFNKCWELIEKANRSPKDVEDMILLANASLWHWKQRSDHKPLNLSIGYWLASRVYAIAGGYDMAKFFASKCLKVSQDSNLAPFYVGYGYEALARAEMVGGNQAKAKALLAKSRQALSLIADEEERKLLEADVASIEKSMQQ